jgi:hypothetical protein
VQCTGKLPHAILLIPSVEVAKFYQELCNNNQGKTINFQPLRLLTCTSRPSFSHVILPLSVTQEESFDMAMQEDVLRGTT